MCTYCFWFEVMLVTKRASSEFISCPQNHSPPFSKEDKLCKNIHSILNNKYTLILDYRLDLLSSKTSQNILTNAQKNGEDVFCHKIGAVLGMDTKLMLNIK